MPRIVSGTGQSVNQALLEGLAAGRGFADARNEKAQLQMQAQAALQKAMLAHKIEQARALKASNDAASQGDLQAIQAQHAEAQASGEPPNRRFLQDITHAAIKIADPAMRKAALGEVAGVAKELQAEEHRQAAMQILEQGVNDGHIDSEALQMRMQAGEKPENIAQEAMKIREQRVKANVAMQESEQALQQAEALLQGAPRGTRGHQMAQHTLEFFRDSPTAQAKPGAAQEMLKRVKDALVLSVADERRMEEEKQAKMQSALSPDRAAPGLGGMTGGERSAEMEKEPTLGFGGPDIPPYEPTGPQAHRTRKMAGGDMSASPKTSAKMSVRSASLDKAIKKAASEEDLIKALQENGVKLTPENITAAANHWRGRGQ